MAEETQPKHDEVAVEETKTQPEETIQQADAAASTGDVPVAETAEPATEAELEAVIPQSASFKEESNVVADLADPEKKALDELKQLVTSALKNNEFNPPPPPPPPEETKVAAERVTLVTKDEEAVVPPDVAEEKKDEGLTAQAAEEEKKDEILTDPVVEKEKEEVFTAPAAEEEKKEGSLTDPPAVAEEDKKEEALIAPVAEAETSKPSEEVSVTPVEEAAMPSTEEAKFEIPVTTAVAADEKTVQAIEESVVPVSETQAKEVTENNSTAQATDESPAIEVPAAEEFIWGVPLLGEEKSDTVLLKFLRARDFNVKEAFTMLKNTLLWRKSFGIESLLDEELGLLEMNKVVFMHGHDKEGHPVCYNVFGEFQEKELYGKAFGDEEKRQKFMRWRIQVLEKGIREQLDFTPGSVCTMVQVNDLKNSPGPAKRELRQTTNQALALLQDNYPEFVAKQVFINVPWWYLAYNRMISPFLTQRTKSKFVFASTSKSADTLFRYIAPEQVPVQYGGLSKESDPDFTTADAVAEITIKPSSKQAIEVPVAEPCVLVWELRVLGWEVTYGAEFVPSAENGYTVIVQKARKFASTDDPVVKNNFKIGEPGKIVLTIDNNSSKKKKLLYRSKAKSTTDSI